MPQTRRRCFCPSCGGPLPSLTDLCTRCGFSAQVCLGKYRFRAPRLERFLDPEYRLTAAEKKRLNRAIDSFEKKFPQTRIYISLARLPHAADSREFGYWLFNACRPQNEEEEQRRYFTILLLIDRGNRTASVTIGYRLEPFLDDYTLQKILLDSREEFISGKYAGAIENFVTEVRKRLTSVHHEFARLTVQLGSAHPAHPQGHAPSTPVTRPA
jgi:uncharacterized membrane protein YgcG